MSGLCPNRARRRVGLPHPMKGGQSRPPLQRGAALARRAAGKRERCLSWARERR
nr:MAG TPA: hypothetical protein [Caudoviricetes sp.]